MLRTVLIYGLLAGAIIVGLATLIFRVFNFFDTSYSELIGYATMLIGLTMVYLEVKRYRDEQTSDEFTFGNIPRRSVGEFVDGLVAT